MPIPRFLSAAVEGSIDEAVIRRLCQDVGFAVSGVHGKNGKQHLLQQFAGYNYAARFSPWVVLLDLDTDANCAPTFLKGLPSPASQMCLRVAVREVESWLVADRTSFATYFSVPIESIPTNPDEEPDPKRLVVNLARRSRSRKIRLDVVPEEWSGQTEGPAYSSTMIDFVQQHWDPSIAANSSNSLRKCMRAFQTFPY